MKPEVGRILNKSIIKSSFEREDHMCQFSKNVPIGRKIVKTFQQSSKHLYSHGVTHF